MNNYSIISNDQDVAETMNTFFKNAVDSLHISENIGKHPVENDRFIICESGSEISSLCQWSILVGMLKGPLTFLLCRAEIQDSISVLSLGDIKKELLLGFFR